MKRLLARSVAAAALFPLSFAGSTSLSAQTLDTFGVLAETEITNTGPTTIDGNLGLNGTLSEITGFPPGLLTGTIYTGIDDSNDVAELAMAELISNYNTYFDMRDDLGTIDLTGGVLGNGGTISTLTVGVYSFDSTAQLTGSLILDAEGDPDAEFIIIMGSSLTTAPSSSVVLANGAQGSNVYWIVGSAATIDTNTTFVGKILSVAEISMNADATITCGAAWSQFSAVTLISNTIVAPASEPCAFAIIDDDVVDDDSTPGEIVDVIEDYVDGGGDLPDAFEELVDLLDGDLTPEEVREVLAQIAGETSTGVAPTVTQSMNSFLSTVLNSGTAPGTERSGPKVATVKALGYAGAATLSPAGSAVSSFGESSTALELNTFDIWAGVYGSNTNADGDSGGGTHDRWSSVFGIAGGVDFNVDHDTRVGIAFSGGTTAFDLSDHLGDGDSNVFQTAVYARQEFDAVYILGALAYGYHDVSTDRTVTLPSPSTFTEDLSADFAAHDIAAQIEAGYRMGWLTPYGAVRLQSIHTPSYSEESSSTDDGFALDYDSNTATNVRTELGARLERIFELQDGARLALRSRIAWAHDLWYGQDGRAKFQSLPGSESFTVRGTSGAEDSLLLSAGAEFGLGNGLALAGWFDGELAEGSETYGGNVRISYGW